MTVENRYVNFRLINTMKQPLYYGSAVAFALWTATPAPLLACAVCLTGADDATAGAFNWSILFMMAAPYLVFGSIVGCLYFIYRRAIARRALEETASSVAHLAFSRKES